MRQSFRVWLFVSSLALTYSAFAKAGGAPELDPSSAGTAIALALAGGLLLLERQRRKR